MDVRTSVQSASVLIKAGEHAKARSILTKAVRAAPNEPVIHQLLGIACSELGRHTDAVQHLRRATQLDPSSPALHLNLGKALQSADRSADALAAFQRSYQLAPQVAAVRKAYAGALVACGRLTEAIDHYQEAVRLEPEDPDGYFNIAEVLMQLGKFAASLSAWEQFAQRQPHAPEAKFRITMCMQNLCDWRDFEKRVSEVQSLVESGVHGGSSLLLVCDDPAVHLKSLQTAPKAVSAPAVLRRKPGSKIKLGYVSGDYRAHPVAKAIGGVIEAHSRDRFTVSAFSLRDSDGSPEHSRLVAAFDTFHQMSPAHTPRAIARALQDNGVDIAIDLMGLTSGSRPRIFSHRAAPIQVNFLGYPGTTGIPEMDYIIVDPFLATDEVRQNATERLAIIPDCYLCTDGRMPAVEHHIARADCNLPDDRFVFGSFNNFAKITPPVFSTWMSILQQVPDSVLALQAGSDVIRSNLSREAEARGVEPARLLFGQRLPLHMHMARLAHVDLHLDTFPYGSHTTAVELLWAGRPIVSMAGRSFPSRVCGSLLTTIGTPELIVRSLDEYAGLAVSLARDRAALERIAARVAEGVKQSPLFDTALFTRNLERLYEEMASIAEAGGRPREIRLQ